MKRNIVILLWLAAALTPLGGCSKLTVNVDVVSDMHSLTYHLDPDGRLTVKRGTGHVQADQLEQLHETHLDVAAMGRLRKVIYNSGFLVESSPTTGSLSGVFIMMDVQLGLWENRLQTRGVKVPSIGSIVAEINTHLPPEHKIPYGLATQPEEDYEKYWK